MFRKIWLAAVGFILIFLALGLVQSEDKMFTAMTSPIFSGIILAVLLRFGVLTLVVFFFVVGLTMDFPLTYDFNVWYFRSSLVPVVAIVSLAAYGFHTALAGRSLFKDDLLET